MNRRWYHHVFLFGPVWLWAALALGSFETDSEMQTNFGSNHISASIQFRLNEKDVEHAAKKGEIPDNVANDFKSFWDTKLSSLHQKASRAKAHIKAGKQASKAKFHSGAGRLRFGIHQEGNPRAEIPPNPQVVCIEANNVEVECHTESGNELTDYEKLVLLNFEDMLDGLHLTTFIVLTMISNDTFLREEASSFKTAHKAIDWVSAIGQVAPFVGQGIGVFQLLAHGVVEIFAEREQDKLTKSARQMLWAINVDLGTAIKQKRDVILECVSGQMVATREGVAKGWWQESEATFGYSLAHAAGVKFLHQIDSKIQDNTTGRPRLQVDALADAIGQALERPAPKGVLSGHANALDVLLTREGEMTATAPPAESSRHTLVDSTMGLPPLQREKRKKPARGCLPWLKRKK